MGEFMGGDEIQMRPERTKCEDLGKVHSGQSKQLIWTWLIEENSMKISGAQWMNEWRGDSRRWGCWCGQEQGHVGPWSFKPFVGL